MTEATFPVKVRARPSSPVVSIAVMGFASVIAFALGLLMGARGLDVAILALALFTGFVAVIPTLLDASRPKEKRQILISIVSFVYGLFLVVPVFTQYFLIDEPVYHRLRLSNMEPPDIVMAQLATLTGLISLLVGFYSPITRLVSSNLPRPTQDWPPAVALAVAAVMLPLGWSVYLAGQFGLIPAAAGSGALGVVASSIFFGISLIAIVYLRHNSRIAFIMLLLAVPPSMVFNFFTGSKTLFLTPLFMVVLAYILMERRVRRSWVIAAIAGLVVLYPISEFYRTVIQRDYTLSAVEILKSPGRALSQISSFFTQADLGVYLESGLVATGIRLDALTIATVIVRDTPERVPYQNGRTLGLIAISYVPRILWPGKPGTTIGEWVTANYGGGIEARENKTDTGPSWIGELYFNFGWVGVIGGMLFMGVYFRVLQDLLFWQGAPIPALLAACVVLYHSARTVQGGLVGPINGVGYSIWPIIAAHMSLRVMGLTIAPRTPSAPAKSAARSPALT